MQELAIKGQTHTNSLGMQFARIEPGSFMMGSENASLSDELTGGKAHLRDGDWDEHPVHEVTLSTPFYIGIYQVTNAQYAAFDPTHRELPSLQDVGFSRDDDEAVVFVDWHDATRFCEWLSEKEGLPYRLPTEAEWEYVCRAGTTTHFHTGDTLPPEFHKNVGESWYPDAGRGRGAEEIVPLHVGQTAPNAWGVHDMHGNVEEWCQDWYGSYEPEPQVDPVGREDGLYRVTRGGSHSTLLCYLRSANRMGAVPEDKHWYIGFRVVCGEMPQTSPIPVPKVALWGRDVKQEPIEESKPPSPPYQGGERNAPYFAEPLTFVKIPDGSNGPLFSAHNHVPAITECPNGDMFAAWYSCVTERGRELTVAASRLRFGGTEWEPAEPFWGPPDRNNHATSLWRNENGRIYHFNGLSAAATWGPLALVMRYSDDNGVTWSKPRFISPEHRLRHMPIASVFRRQDGSILLACDAVSGGDGGTAIWLSEDDGETWYDPGAGQPIPEFADGKQGGWIAGIHAAVVELTDGRLMAYGRGDTIDGRMPKSVSSDGGKTWHYSASPFPVVSGGQRCVLLRLQEGPIFLASFTGDRREPTAMPIVDASGNERLVTGLFGALSYDDGETWECIRLITDDGEDKDIETMDGRPFQMGLNSAEPGGYLAVCQGQNGIIHLISSRLHYQFNLAWLKETPPSEVRS